MKLHFDWQNDGAYHQYCMHCHGETVVRLIEDGLTHYTCSSCHQPADRSIVIDPVVTWWVDETGEYWHESAGVFVRNELNQFLFFERTIFPFAFTVPAGHVDAGEAALTSAVRELKEEVDLDATDLTVITEEDIIGDSCRRGSDAHRWHAYLHVVPETPPITILEEGVRPVWLTIDEALTKELTYPVRYILERYKDRLLSV